MRPIPSLRPSVVIALLLLPSPAGAVTVDPKGVNVRHAGPTTVFLTFQGLAPGQRAEDGIWCGDIFPDGSCVPGTVFGRLPARFDLARPSAMKSFTDVMTIPSSVARRAYQSAERGDPSQFFYVRRFSGEGPDEFVPVTCRMAGGGARAPLALLEVALRFEVDEPVLFVPRGTVPPLCGADLVYNGSGRLKGRFEVVHPGDPQPRTEDLLTEASLPFEARVRQRRYALLGRFDVFLPPTGEAFLPCPSPETIPHRSDGLYQILLRVEATDDRESRSDVSRGGPTLLTGGVAGFPMPVLRYYVGSDSERDAFALRAARETVRLLTPRPRERLSSRVNFTWLAPAGAAFYSLEVRGPSGPVLEAVVESTVSGYTAPPFLAEHADHALEWRVVALDSGGAAIARSAWREFRIEP